MSDKAAQHDLLLFIVNDGALYRQQGQPIIDNLRKKFSKGVFDQAKAVKLYRYLADNGAKKYTFDYGDTGGASNWRRVKGYGIFSVADRNAVAAELLAHYIEQITGYHADARVKKNPARRRKGGKRGIRRAGLSLTAYVRRPSQITRKKPSKRLTRRRTKTKTRPARGYFPNPTIPKGAYVLQSKSGSGWKTENWGLGASGLRVMRLQAGMYAKHLGRAMRVVRQK